MNASWKQIYPRDCYRVLLQMSGETGISFPKLVNIVIREGLIRLGKLPEETSQAHLLRPTPIQNKTKEKPKKPEPISDKELERLHAAMIRCWPNYDLVGRIQALRGVLSALNEHPHLQNAKKILEMADPREVQAVKNAMSKYDSLREIIDEAMAQLRVRN